MKLVILILVICIASTKGAGIEIKSPPHPGPSFFINIVGGIGQTFLGFVLGFSHARFLGERRIFTLPDGTKLGGLLFESKHAQAEPLIIANFGVLADSLSNPAPSFIRFIVKPDKLHASVLIVDGGVSESFYKLNHNIDIGGYDEGRSLVELASILPQYGIKYSSLHLMGVSLGGNAVLQALIEAARLKYNFFSSAAIFSGALNEEASTQAVLTAFGHPLLGLPDRTRLSEGGKIILEAALETIHLGSTFYGTKSKYSFPSPWQNVGEFFYNGFKKRISFLKGESIKKFPWNPKISLKSVAQYVQTSSTVGLQGINHIHIPVLIVQAQDDPIVAFGAFKTIQNNSLHNPNIETLGTRDGGHWGFITAYGPTWVEQLIKKMLIAGKRLQKRRKFAQQH